MDRVGWHPTWQPVDVAGADVWLTGATAIGIDVSDRLADALPASLAQLAPQIGRWNFGVSILAGFGLASKTKVMVVPALI